ncbi:MAG TPA: ATP-binding protein [Vicinamibacterales bacterium]|nr:ATP-binding protein [Vicinamibacterales bacterium]
MPTTRPDSSVLDAAIVPVRKDFQEVEKLRESSSGATEAARVQGADEPLTNERLAAEHLTAPRDEFGTPRFTSTPISETSTSERVDSLQRNADSIPTQPITVIIPADSQYVLVVRLAVTGVASRMAFAYDQVEDIKLAVAEACNNAILHAAPLRAASATAPDTMPLVTVQMMPYPDRLEVRVFDEGRVPPPGLPAPRRRASAGQSTLVGDEASKELAESGLGLLLIQTLMDEVSHHTSAVDRTEVHMTKRLSQ